MVERDVISSGKPLSSLRQEPRCAREMPLPRWIIPEGASRQSPLSENAYRGTWGSSPLPPRPASSPLISDAHGN